MQHSAERHSKRRFLGRRFVVCLVITLVCILSLPDSSVFQGAIILLFTSLHIRPGLEAALIYATCGPHLFSASHSPIPSFRRECNHSDGYDYCFEAGTYLDFIIERYVHPLAERYVFAHGHDNSLHYRLAFLKALRRVYRAVSSKCCVLYIDVQIPLADSGSTMGALLKAFSILRL
jgi:hypothetical protein